MIFKDGEGEKIEGGNGEGAEESAGQTPGQTVIAEKFNRGGLNKLG